MDTSLSSDYSQMAWMTCRKKKKMRAKVQAAGKATTTMAMTNKTTATMETARLKIITDRITVTMETARLKEIIMDQTMGPTKKSPTRKQVTPATLDCMLFC